MFINWKTGFSRRAFTLVEMLTVMAIISVLLVVTVPALKGINSTGSRKSAVRTMMGVLDQARMLAISDGKATYVVFAGPNLVNTPCASMIGHAYAVYEDNADYTPVQRSPWIYLPVGVAYKVAKDYDTLVNRSLNSTTDPQFFVTTTKLSGQPTQQYSMPYVKFDATGAVDTSSSANQSPQSLRVLLFDGTVTVDAAEVSTRHPANVTNQNILLDEIVINPATGRAKYTLDPNDNLPATST